jgi:multicomponent Na+:H+ antiporter subunit G
MSEIIGYIFIIVGLAFDTLGCIGLIRLPDVYNRLQATTKCVTMGTCSILLGTIIIKGVTTTSIKALLCIIFLLLTSPVAAHALSRGAHIFGVRLWEKSVCDKYAEDKKK